MSSIAIKFPHIKRSFVACKEVFEKYADPETNSLSKERVADILLELGARRESLNEERVSSSIETATLNKDDSIDFKGLKHAIFIDKSLHPHILYDQRVSDRRCRRLLPESEPRA